MGTVRSARTLVAVHAHPDDESITMGGTLARYRSEGVRTVVVTCTGGDLGEVLDPTLVGKPVATVRAQELARAAQVLGVSRVVQLGYADSGMPGEPWNDRAGAFWAAEIEEAATRLLKVLEEERPQVLVSYDETGGYRHPDHVKANLVTVEAFRRYANQPARLFFIRFPLTWSRSFVASLRANGIEAPGSAPSGADAGPAVTEIGVDDRLVTTRVDVRGYVQAKLSALECYASQLPSDHFLRRMPPDVAQQLWSHEFYSLESGGSPIPADDLFQGLT